MKNLITLALLAILAVPATSKANETAGLTWYTNLDSVVTISNETKKPIFGFFTGSDWCGWCIKLQKNVFAKQAFIDWANESVVLLELDFPRSVPQSDELKTQNQNLQRAFGVQGYPTVWIFTALKDEATTNFSLTAWGKLGYPSGPDVVVGKEEEKFLADAAAVMAKNPAKTN
ncbi:MAG: thioredoxin family protein [Bacteroidetes bacterium]|nr:thioredoxin family protein [Bacteroidota bacterium]